VATCSCCSWWWDSFIYSCLDCVTYKYYEVDFDTMTYVRTQQCKYILENGERCKKRTNSPVGYCSKHFSLVKDYYEAILLKCKDCLVSDQCEFKDSVSGYCYFEAVSENFEFTDKDQLLDAMKTLLKAEMRVFRRLERRLTAQRADRYELDLFNKLGNNLFTHLRNYGRFCGYEEPKMSIEERRDKIYILKKVFLEKPSPKDEIKEVIKIDVPVVKRNKVRKPAD